MSRPVFTERTENAGERAVRRGTVHTEHENGYVSPGSGTQLVTLGSASHDGVIAEQASVGTVSNVDPSTLECWLWIGNNADSVTFDNARVFLPFHPSGGPADFTQPIPVQTGEKAVLYVNYNDGGASSDASVEGSLVYREDEY